jgi:SpoVK/Ycf46/Vps4 family AAA+-type ATPase
MEAPLESNIKDTIVKSEIKADLTLNNTKYGTLTVTHTNVPFGYDFMLKCCITNSNILHGISKYWKINSIFEVDGGSRAIPSTGFYNIEGILIWIHNQHKNGYMYLHFKNQDDYFELQKKILEKDNSKIKEITNPVYRYCPRNGWRLVDQYGTKNADKDIFGCDDYISQIEKDIKNHIKYTTFLKSLGEVRSINYLLYGPPGTGKTSMIKAIASKLGCSVFIVNAGNVSINNISSILSPNVAVQSECKIKLLLFEDFDRFLVVDKVDTVMSQILNSLDGFDDKGDTVRFFTANNAASIFCVDALINRMSAKYKFEFPTIEIFRGKLERFLSFHESYDNDKKEELLRLVVEKKVTVRPFVNFVIRYLFDDNCLDVMIENINELK